MLRVKAKVLIIDVALDMLDRACPRFRVEMVSQQSILTVGMLDLCVSDRLPHSYDPNDR